VPELRLDLSDFRPIGGQSWLQEITTRASKPGAISLNERFKKTSYNYFLDIWAQPWTQQQFKRSDTKKWDAWIYPASIRTI
jgi:hypothetical protein